MKLTKIPEAFMTKLQLKNKIFFIFFRHVDYNS